MLELIWQSIEEIVRRLTVVEISEWIYYVGCLTMFPELQQRKIPSLKQ